MLVSQNRKLHVAVHVVEESDIHNYLLGRTPSAGLFSALSQTPTGLLHLISFVNKF